MKNFFNRLIQFSKGDLFQTSLWNGIATIIKMGTGLISNKIVAVYLGPSGIALLGQFNNFIGMATQFATGGFNAGVTKYLAEYRGDEEKQKEILSTGLKTTLITTLIVALVVFIGADYFGTSILQTGKYKSLFYIFAVTLVLFTLNGFFISVLNGYKEFKKIVYVNITTSFIGLAIAVLLIVSYGIWGALLGLILSTTLISFVTFGFVYKSNWFKIKNFTSKITWEGLRKLSKFTAMSFTSIFAVIYIQLTIRTYIINHLSIQEAGIWQGVVKISDIYLSIITTTLGYYYLPRLSEIKDKIELRKEIFKGYKFLLPVTLISGLMVYLLRGFIVSLLFSAEFKEMENLFFFQLLGDMFKIASWLLAYLMLAKSLTKVFITTELVFGVGYFGLVYLFMKFWGLQGTVIAYSLNYFFYLVLFIIFFRKILFGK